VVNRAHRTALAQAMLTDEAGRLVAHASSMCMIFSPAAPAAGTGEEQAV
jgi:acyl-coenzyme A thioesterase PaaI-like protein